MDTMGTSASWFSPENSQLMIITRVQVLRKCPGNYPANRIPTGT